ncbi:BMA_0021/BMA_0022 family TOMM bacteriocin [Sorangium sp. So ce1335]|uniref:BMA_0021/BMA_0022 family TOMM bacteriocin n=1 Tax=Sorangium sp. So ce1335 TaxID=3133335 RepID=UPI003F62E6C9
MFKDEAAAREPDAPACERACDGAQRTSLLGPGEPAPLGEGTSLADRLQAFESACLRAIALAWEDEAKLELLRRDPRRFFRTCCDYELPQNLALNIREAREAPPAERGAWGWDGRHGKWNLPRAEITLYIPPPPELTERAVALAELGDPDKLPPICC